MTQVDTASSASANDANTVHIRQHHTNPKLPSLTLSLYNNNNSTSTGTGANNSNAAASLANSNQNQSLDSPNYPQRFLPKQMVMGSPFYQTSDSTFKFQSSPSENFSHSPASSTSRNIKKALMDQSKEIELEKQRQAENTIKEEEEEDEEEENEDQSPVVANSNVDNISPSTTPPFAPINDDAGTNEDDDTSGFQAESSPIKQAPLPKPPVNIKPINTRCIKFSSLHPDISLTDILDLITFGPIENSYFDLTSKENTNSNRSIIISFIDSFTSNQCYIHLMTNLDDLKHLLNSPELSIKPMDSQPLSDFIKHEINNNGATRAICLANLPYNLSNSILINELSKFGTIQSVEYNINKNAAFINFTSIFMAIKCFDQLPLSNSVLANSKIFYSNDGNSPAIGNNSTTATTSATTNYYDNDHHLPYSRTSTSISSPRISSTDLPNFKDNDTAQRNNNNNNNNNRNNNRRRNNRRNNYNNYNNYNNSNSTIMPNSSYFQDPYTPAIYDYEYMNPSLYDDENIINNSMNMSNMNNTNNTPFYRLNDITGNGNFSMTSLLQNNVNNRTVYLGNISSTTTNEDICNKIRGGVLEKIKLFPEKKVAFVTFIYHHDAANFISRLFNQNLFINSKCIKIGWGKNPGNLNPDIQLAVDYGACRNLYIGINEELETEDDYELIPTEHDGETEMRKIYHIIPNEDTLRRDFSIFGEIEQINFFKNGSCAFINFTNIISCIKAIDDFNNTETNDELHNSFQNKYRRLNISYGKDRCGNPPKKRRIKKDRRTLNLDDVGEDDETADHDGNDDNDGESIDTDLALKFNSAFSSMGITSPSANKKVSSRNNNEIEENDEIKDGSKSKEKKIADDDDDEDDDDDIDIVTETLNHSLVPNTSSNKYHNYNKNDNSNPRTRRNSFKSNNRRLYSSSRSSSMTSFHNYPYSNMSNNYSFSYPDNYINDSQNLMMTPQSYYYAPTTPASAQFLMTPSLPPPQVQQQLSPQINRTFSGNFYQQQQQEQEQHQQYQQEQFQQHQQQLSNQQNSPGYYYYSNPQSQPQLQSMYHMHQQQQFQSFQNSKPKNYRRFNSNNNNRRGSFNNNNQNNHINANN